MFGLFTREDCSDLGLSQQKIFINQPTTTLGVQDPRIVLSLSPDEPLSTETMSWVDILQLIRAVGQKQNYRLVH